MKPSDRSREQFVASIPRGRKLTFKRTGVALTSASVLVRDNATNDSGPGGVLESGATVHLIHHTFGRGGGMERYAIILASSFKQLGYRVMIHAVKADQALAHEVGATLQMVPGGAAPKKLQDFSFFRQMRRFPVTDTPQVTLARVCSRDLVVCGGTHRGYLRAARKIPGPFDYLQIWMETRAYHSARVVLSHSDLCRQELQRLYKLPAAKIATLYPPIASEISPRTTAAQAAAWRREQGLPLDKVVLLFPSMGHRRKGFIPLCRALSTFSDQIVLAVAGKRIASGTWPFVRYLGYVEDMARAYEAADFTILASFYEPFGLVGPESILCGTRLLFEEKIGCLPQINPEFVMTFSVWNQNSIRDAIARAIALARAGQHHILSPRLALRYDPSAQEHAKALLRL